VGKGREYRSSTIQPFLHRNCCNQLPCTTAHSTASWVTIHTSVPLLCSSTASHKTPEKGLWNKTFKMGKNKNKRERAAETTCIINGLAPNYLLGHARWVGGGCWVTSADARCECAQGSFLSTHHLFLFMIIQLSHFSPFSLASLSLLFRVLFIYFPFIYFLFLFPPVGALLFLQGGAFFLPLHFRRDEWFGLAPVLGGCDGFFFAKK